MWIPKCPSTSLCIQDAIVKEFLSNPNVPNLLNLAGVEKLITHSLPIEEPTCINLISPHNTHTTTICKTVEGGEPTSALMLPALHYVRPWLPNIESLLHAHLSLYRELGISPYFYEYSGPLVDIVSGIQALAHIKVGLKYTVITDAGITLNDHFEEKILSPRVALLLPYSIRSLKFYASETGRFKIRICCIKSLSRHDNIIVCLEDSGCTLEVENGVTIRGPHILLRGKCSGEAFRRALTLLLYSKLASVIGVRKYDVWFSVSGPGFIVATELEDDKTINMVLWNMSLTPHTTRLKIRGYRIIEAYTGHKRLEPIVPIYDEVYVALEGLELKRVRLKVEKLPPLLTRRSS